jgi:aconitate hydratase
MASPDLDHHSIRRLYATFEERHALGRKRLGRPLTLTEKILFAHFEDAPNQPLTRGRSTAVLRPDRVAMQDATAQMALLQFMTAGRERVALPTTVHCDHLILARFGASEDLRNAMLANDEVFEFLKTAAARHGIGFWQPGAGIIHQVVLENYAFPGGLLIGTDSHTPNAGGLGMMAVGVGGADAVDAMVDMPWSVTLPKLIGVRLTGRVNGWTAPKDVILKLAGILSVKGGTGAVIEYFGDGARALSCTGKATITNMGAEVGATTSIFPFDERMATYLRATNREEVARLAEQHLSQLVADPEVEAHPEDFFDCLVEIDLSTLEPHVVGPHTPDLARPVSQLARDADAHGYPLDIKVALVGSCTNSSYEDIGRAAHVARAARAHGLRVRTEFLVTPGSDQIYQTIRRDGLLEVLEAIGGRVLANACGPCIGQWQRDDIQPGEQNTIVTSFNRNFARRNDGNAATLAFIASPELVTALALGGRLDFNPLTDSLPAGNGGAVHLEPPSAPELPERGFVHSMAGYVAPASNPEEVSVLIRNDSERLQRLEPFPPSPEPEITNLRILLRAHGKCTTDHISAAGPWLRYRGHLDNISNNLFLGALNGFTGETGKGVDVDTGERGVPLPELARRYKARGMNWLVVGDENYGEGSSREHAAMEPRFLGGRAVVARSFARIHETNLKKQGMLPLIFDNPDDYERFRADDRVAIRDLARLAPDSEVELVLSHADGSEERIRTRHTLTPQQIEWFRAGSALNTVVSQ